MTTGEKMDEERFSEWYIARLRARAPRLREQELAACLQAALEDDLGSFETFLSGKAYGLELRGCCKDEAP